jgi:SAM-dependent methyltransferase
MRRGYKALLPLPDVAVDAYLSACLAFKNEASYLREWIEFHRLVGVERFFLYNHASLDGHREALAPYLEDGLVTLEDWPDVPAAQTDMYNHCLAHHGSESRWIAFLDTDEFLFSPTGEQLPGLLAEYEQWPGLVANWAIFGTSGHRTRPPGLVIESYRWRNDEPDEPRNKIFKCIVDPARVTRCLDPHSFEFTDGGFVDERKRPVEGQFTERPLYSRIRINHYYTRSEEECAHKYARGRGSDAVRMRGGEAPLEHLHDKLHDKRDEAILGYVPALRNVLAEVNERAPFDPDVFATQSAPAADGRVRYFERGQGALRSIEAAIESADRLLPRAAARSFDRILDFACGRGRVLRVLKAAFPDSELTACDIDTDAVDFCADVFGAVPLYSHEDPSRIETDATFDLIWCGSLFSHLAADRWPGFLEFFEHRLRPWGLLVFSASGRYHVTEETAADFARGGYVFQDHGAGSGWGTAVASPAWVCRRLETRPGLRLIGYAERAWNQKQDVVACARIGPRVQVAELQAARPSITEDELIEVTGYDEPTILRLLEGPEGPPPAAG